MAIYYFSHFFLFMMSMRLSCFLCFFYFGSYQWSQRMMQHFYVDPYSLKRNLNPSWTSTLQFLCDCWLLFARALCPQAVFPFPKQYAQWKEGCFMYEPGVIPTTRGPHAAQAQLDKLPQQVNFRVSIPKAEAVAVVADQNWTHLERLQVGRLEISQFVMDAFRNPDFFVC